jgi:hypothetical protein
MYMLEISNEASVQLGFISIDFKSVMSCGVLSMLYALCSVIYWLSMFWLSSVKNLAVLYNGAFFQLTTV